MRHRTRDDITEVAGGDTDQHITGHDEDGTFQTDLPPGTTPANGSSNAGINSTHANRQVPSSERTPQG